jgi:hypothetical protein
MTQSPDPIVAEAPRYRLLGPFWSTGNVGHGPGPGLLQAGTEIEHHGEPNPRIMDPINNAARVRMGRPPVSEA